MAHILIVCTANICRSPVGEAVLRDRLATHGLDDWTVSSAGTWAQWKRGASEHSVTLMAEQGIDITGHQAQIIELEHMQQSDLILCMESGHVQALKAEFPLYANKVYYFSEMAGQQYSITDPYGGTLNEYRRMTEELTTIIDDGLERIIALATENAS
jgi:protein-tyrosine-phosphatase